MLIAKVSNCLGIILEYSILGKVKAPYASMGLVVDLRSVRDTRVEAQSSETLLSERHSRAAIPVGCAYECGVVMALSEPGGCADEVGKLPRGAGLVRIRHGIATAVGALKGRTTDCRRHVCPPTGAGVCCTTSPNPSFQ